MRAEKRVATSGEYTTLAAERRTSRMSNMSGQGEAWKSVTFAGEKGGWSKEEAGDEEEESRGGLFKKYWERERNSVVGKKKISSAKVKEVSHDDDSAARNSQEENSTGSSYCSGIRASKSGRVGGEAIHNRTSSEYRDHEAIPVI